MEQARLRSRIEEVTERPAPGVVEVFTDTTDFTNIWRGHIIRLGDRDFVVEGDMREGRFGIDDQPKFWVKKALDLDTGDRKILKLVFNEEFSIRIGLLRIRCYRDPEKETRVLDAFRGDARLMQGTTLRDDRGNSVRVLDYIRGGTIYRRLKDLSMDHETYYRRELPGLLTKLVGAFEAIAAVHEKGHCHGDIRNDHLIIESGSGRIRWIDFDLCQDVSDFDVWSIGNILLYVVGMGERTFHDAKAGRVTPVAPLSEHDASAFFVHRVINLRKLFPWVSPELNRILMHFSYGTREFYESVNDILADLKPAVRALGDGGLEPEARSDR